MQEEFEEYPIAYSIDNAILMHRDAHFAGSFPIMLEYYAKNGKGVNSEFEISRIRELWETEQKTGQNLSVLMLSGAEAEKVARARKSYLDLRSLYTKSAGHKKTFPLLIADLILAEEEEVPEAIQAVIAQKGAVVTLLIDLLRSEDFHDPLFPGYGEAPALAAKCLGMIADKRSLISLFEAIGSEDFFNEDIILEALHSIGQPAKTFLLKVLHGRPLTIDNEHAALALSWFKDDPEVSASCLKILQEIDLPKNELLATFLVLACESLTPPLRQELLAIAGHPKISKALRNDILIIASSNR